MIEIPIPKTIYNEVEKLIQDDAIKREFGYDSVQDFVIENIERCIVADKDVAGMNDHLYRN